VSAEAETDNPQSELKPGLDLLGPVDEIFYDIYDRYEPVNEPSLDNCFVSTVRFANNSKMNIKLHCLGTILNPYGVFSMQSYDATTHFETTVTDVLNMYTMITGKVTYNSSFFSLKRL
jgi:Rab GDP dissociation inhibitor